MAMTLMDWNIVDVCMETFFFFEMQLFITKRGQMLISFANNHSNGLMY